MTFRPAPMAERGGSARRSEPRITCHVSCGVYRRRAAVREGRNDSRARQGVDEGTGDGSVNQPTTLLRKTVATALGRRVRAGRVYDTARLHSSCNELAHRSKALRHVR